LLGGDMVVLMASYPSTRNEYALMNVVSVLF